MEDFREKCLDKNYRYECPIDGRLCSEIKECPQGEKEVLRNYNERMRGKTEVSKSKFGRCPFERYPDTDWEKLPVKYLEFLLKPECYTDPRNKATAKGCLLKRKFVTSNLNWRR